MTNYSYVKSHNSLGRNSLNQALDKWPLILSLYMGKKIQQTIINSFQSMLNHTAIRQVDFSHQRCYFVVEPFPSMVAALYSSKSFTLCVSRGGWYYKKFASWITMGDKIVSNTSWQQQFNKCTKIIPITLNWRRNDLEQDKIKAIPSWFQMENSSSAFNEYQKYSSINDIKNWYLLREIPFRNFH